MGGHTVPPLLQAPDNPFWKEQLRQGAVGDALSVLALATSKQGSESFWMTLPQGLHKRNPLRLHLTVSFGVSENLGRYLETS